MAKLRKAVAYRKVERPYTRKSKYTKKNYVRAVPQNLIVKYDMGNLQKKFQYTIVVNSKDAIQVRHNAIEAARKTANRVLEKKAGKSGFMLKIRIYPHHILRENPLASGAGADRMSTGMKKSFGKPIGLAAQIKPGQTLFEVNVDKTFLLTGKTAAKRIAAKMPCRCQILVNDNKIKASA
ncbi:MAG: 50S ribosomal protein L16 [Nanoarchaeota archaeon]|nr:50S ribosomal protein L16 [Nanoarchaeota archaeon]MBU1321631.1 50S ribosomal protein L16 [Nanoarchaeota archaeon]MBU1597415.1 50S ribosomal protein L16 [Nanoarchaeota archaeon]MBU2440922.1 50S ribosomal protein L16 [Nanoarchaeota archaeon]